MKKWNSNNWQGRTASSVESSYAILYVALWFAGMTVLALILT